MADTRTGNLKYPVHLTTLVIPKLLKKIKLFPIVFYIIIRHCKGCKFSGLPCVDAFGNLNYRDFFLFKNEAKAAS